MFEKKKLRRKEGIWGHGTEEQSLPDFLMERPVHKVLGGGTAADIFLWKDKKVSVGVLGFATLIWVLFGLLHLG